MTANEKIRLIALLKKCSTHIVGGAALFCAKKKEIINILMDIYDVPICQLQSFLDKLVSGDFHSFHIVITFHFIMI